MWEVSTLRYRAMTDIEFAETYRGLTYISDAELTKGEDFVRVHMNLIPLRPVSILMAFVACVLTPLLLMFAGEDWKMNAGLTVAGISCAGLFIGLLWLVNRSRTDAALPSIDIKAESLVLPSGTSIPKQNILRFHQCECTIKTTNFRLVLTSVDTLSCNRRFAVCAEVGRFKTTEIGKRIADELGKDLRTHDRAIKSVEQLKELGLS